MGKISKKVLFANILTCNRHFLPKCLSQVEKQIYLQE